MSKEAEKIIWWALSKQGDWPTKNGLLDNPVPELKYWIEAERILRDWKETERILKEIEKL